MKLLPSPPVASVGNIQLKIKIMSANSKKGSTAISASKPIIAISARLLRSSRPPNSKHLYTLYKLGAATQGEDAESFVHFAISISTKCFALIHQLRLPLNSPKKAHLNLSIGMQSHLFQRPLLLRKRIAQATKPSTVQSQFNSVNH